MGELKITLFYTLMCFIFFSHSALYSLSISQKHLQLAKSSQTTDQNCDFSTLALFMPSISCPFSCIVQYFATFSSPGFDNLRSLMRNSSSLVVGSSTLLFLSFSLPIITLTDIQKNNSATYKLKLTANNARSQMHMITIASPISHLQQYHMELIKSNVDQLRKLKPTKFLEQVFSLVIIVGSALALWKALCLGMNTECPVVVVLTGSMEPGYLRGDILFVSHWNQPLVPGDVVVYNLRGQPIPIVHRVMTVQERQDGNLYILTKGDNNNVDDRGLYPGNMKWLHREDLMGKMRAYLPYMGMFTIWLNDYAWFKFTVLGLMGFFVLIAKDPQ